MKKLIKLLVEGLFDDIYDLNNDVNDVIELGDEIYSYKVGDIIYENKKPYAICCGESNDFNDKKSRFLDYKNLIETQIIPSYISCQTEYQSLSINSKKIKIEKIVLNPNLKILIDENGYETTNKVKQLNSKIKAFNECIKLGENHYFPAVDEVYYMLINIDKLNSIIGKLKDGIMISTNLWDFYWSSTQTKDRYQFLSLTYNYKNMLIIEPNDILCYFLVRPFIKIN